MASSIRNLLKYVFLFLLISSPCLAQQYVFTIWDAQQFGAKEDGVTDDTSILNSTLANLSTAVGQTAQVGYLQITGLTRVCGLIIPRNTAINFVGGKIKITDTCSTTYPISSEGYAANVANNYICGVNSSVPSWYGFNNGKVDCNKAHATYPGACVSFYGPSQILSGQNLIENALNSPALVTKDAPGGTTSAQCQEESHYDKLVIKNGNGQGWWPATHDAYLEEFNGEFNADCSFVGGGFDHIGLLHTVAETNGCGAIINNNIKADIVMSDGDTITIPSTAPGPIHINELHQLNCGYNGTTNCLDNQSSVTVIDSAFCEPYLGSASMTCINWGTAATQNAFNSTLNNFKTFGTSGANSIGIDNYTAGSIFNNIQIAGFSATNSIGFRENGSNNKITGQITNSKTDFVYNGAAGGNEVDLTIYTVSGQSDYTGTFNVSDNVRIVCQGSGTCHNFNQISPNIGIGSSSPRASIDDGQNTDAIILASGTTAQRPTAVNGMVRYNSSNSNVEAYYGGAWNVFAAGGSGTVSSGTANNMALYSSTGTTVSGSTSLPNGITATTQSAADNSTKVATTAYVDAAAGGSSNSAEVYLTTVNASGASNVVFNSTYITSTYKKYVVEFDGVYVSSGGPNLILTVSTNNGSTYQSSSYQYACQNQTNGSGSPSNVGNTSQSSINLTCSGSTALGSSQANAGMGTIKFSNPSDGNTYTTFLYNLTSGSSTSNQGTSFGSGAYVGATTAINNIKIAPSSGATISGNFSLYGLK